MEVLIPSLSGFCPGVKRAEEKIFNLRKSYPEKPIYVLGYMINNKKYIEHLASLRIITVENVDAVPEDSFVAIRTHGIDRHEEEKLKGRFRVIDLTCANVKKVQHTIKEYSDNGFSVLVTGKKDHPEIRGLISYARTPHIIEDKADQEYLLRNLESVLFPALEDKKLLIISQTTGNRIFFEDTVSLVNGKWHSNTGCGAACIESRDTICPITDKKEEQALVLQKKSDISFVIGDPLSSNAHKLYQRLSSCAGNVHFIEDACMLKELDLPLSQMKRALVVSSASTPLFIENEVCDFLLASGSPEKTRR